MRKFMLKQRSKVFDISLVLKILLLTVISSGYGLGCNPKPPVVSGTQGISTISFCDLTPYYGNESELRDPSPRTTRLEINSESVEGLHAAIEGMIRFPVEIEEGARLAFRLGATAPNDNLQESCNLKVEFMPIESEESVELYKASSDDYSMCTLEWIDIDISLENCPSGKGEIRFVSSNLPRNEETTVFWGAPSIYYPQKRKHRNVLLIGVDTLRADGLSMYGGREEVTPFLAEFAHEAALFTQARSQAPLTRPSFASMLTGLLPSALNPTFSTDPIPDHATSIAEYLRPEGYATGSVCGNPHLADSNSGFQQGVDGLWYELSAEPDISVEKTIEFIERSKDRDWFMFLHFMDPHGPLDPPQEFIDILCDSDYPGNYVTEFADGHIWQIIETIPDERDIRQVRDLYDCEVADVDSAMRTLVDYLRDSGLLDETLIIFASDHGEEFFEHGQFEHGHTLYDELVHLPLIVRGEGFPEGVETDTVAANLDIVPSIMKWLDLPLPDGLHGVPLQSVLDGEYGNDRLIMGDCNLRRGSHAKFVVQWPYKCILDFFTGETSLYNLESDPDETLDISIRHGDLVDQLSTDMVMGMPPIQDMALILIGGNIEEEAHRFSGTIEVKGGIAMVVDSVLDEEKDSYAVNGNTITFEIFSEFEAAGNIKALIIIPVDGKQDMEVSVRMDGQIAHERFYPYGISEPELSGTATVNIYEFPWPANYPVDAQVRPVSFYLYCVPGFADLLVDPEMGFGEFDEDKLEELRALGYIT